MTILKRVGCGPFRFVPFIAYNDIIMSETIPTIETAVVGGGCFWCLDSVYRRVEGVIAVTSGYSGGVVKDPSYQEIEMGHTGHAQVVKVDFDPRVITYEEILHIFWAMHDPTTQDRQGYDVGRQYRSIILFVTDKQRRIAENVKSEIVPLWPKPIVTEILPFSKFFEAEDYHQDFYKSGQRPDYCEIVINPKLAKLREKFAKRLRKDPV